MAPVEATEPAPSDQGEHLLPDLLPTGHSLRRRSSDDCQPEGDRLRMSDDSVQYSRLFHIHCVAKQAQVVQPYHGRIHSKFTKVDDGGAAKAEVNRVRTHPAVVVPSIEGLEVEWWKSGPHPVPAEDAYGRRQGQTSSGLERKKRKKFQPLKLVTLAQANFIQTTIRREQHALVKHNKNDYRIAISIYSINMIHYTFLKLVTDNNEKLYMFSC